MIDILDVKAVKQPETEKGVTVFSCYEGDNSNKLIDAKVFYGRMDFYRRKEASMSVKPNLEAIKDKVFARLYKKIPHLGIDYPKFLYARSPKEAYEMVYKEYGGGKRAMEAFRYDSFGPLNHYIEDCIPEVYTSIPAIRRYMSSLPGVDLRVFSYFFDNSYWFDEATDKLPYWELTVLGFKDSEPERAAYYADTLFVQSNVYGLYCSREFVVVVDFPVEVVRRKDSNGIEWVKKIRFADGFELNED